MWLKLCSVHKENECSFKVRVACFCVELETGSWA